MSGYALEFVEIDIKYCSLRYGEGACAASGTVKCFNTKATCQARPSYTEQIVTLRFGRNSSEYERSGIDHIPCLENVNLMPARISLGEDLGTRAALDVSFVNIPWPDTGLGFDKYADDRSYDPFKTGTFWGKFLARQPFLQGQPIRHIQGFLGQPLVEMTTRHFEIETFSKTNKSGASISARDILKRADGDRAQCPVASSGYIRSDITSTDTSFLLSPIGIGNLEYPTNGLAAIGGKEVVRFTRSGDTMTITRAQENTDAVAHKAQDKVQVCKEWFGVDPADIAYDLLVNHAGVPDSYIDLQAWKDETSAYVRRLYSAVIASPEDVNKLLKMLVKEVGIAIWWDEVTKKVRLKALRQIPTDAYQYNDTNILQGSIRVQEQLDKRSSQVWVHFGLRTPLLSPNDATNYLSTEVYVNADAENDYNESAIDQIYSRFIPQFGRAVANRAALVHAGMYLKPPKLITFNTFKSDDDYLPPLAGEGYNIYTPTIESSSGLPDTVPAQVVSIAESRDRYAVTAQELRFINVDPELDDNRTIIIDTDTYNFNWRTEYDRLFPAPTIDDEIVCIVQDGVMLGSRSYDIPAFSLGNWPTGIIPKLIVRGMIQGAGGAGGNGISSGRSRNGQPGGTGVYARSPLTIEHTGIIGGGGGGGGAGGWADGVFAFGGGSGGGGAGRVAGLAGVLGPDWAEGSSGENGTLTTGGAGGKSHGGFQASQRGGNRGMPGIDSTYGDRANPPGNGGAAGRAIDGNSYITLTGSGQIIGPRVN